MRSWSGGTLYCAGSPNFSTTFRIDLNFHVAKKHSTPKLDVKFNCNFCYQDSPGFQPIQPCKNTQHDFRIQTANAETDNVINELDDLNLKEELRSCQHFLLVSELEGARHKTSNYAIGKLNETVVRKKRDHFFNNLKYAANVSLVFRFILKNIEDRGLRYFYALENIILLDRSKDVCTNATNSHS